MYKLVFDFDGTLVDSMETYSKSMLNILEKNNIEYPDDLIKIITPLGLKGTADYFINEMKVSMSFEEILNDMKDYMLHEYMYNVPAKQTVIETLKKLKEKGFSLNVLTASPHITLDNCLKRLNMWDLFDNVWSCDDFSTTKADVNIYYAVAEKLGTTTENCVFFDDNIDAVSTASVSGMKTVGVYDKSSEDYKQQIIEKTDKYIFKFSDLLD